MKVLYGLIFGLLIGVIGTNVVLDITQIGMWEAGYKAATRQIRLQLERGYQDELPFELNEWPDIRFYPRGDRTGVNYDFK